MHFASACVANSQPVMQIKIINKIGCVAICALLPLTRLPALPPGLPLHRAVVLRAGVQHHGQRAHALHFGARLRVYVREGEVWV